MTSMAFRIVRKATLWSDYVALGGGEEGCEDGIPRPIPYVFSSRRVCDMRACYNLTVDSHARIRVRLNLNVVP